MEIHSSRILSINYSLEFRKKLLRSLLSNIIKPSKVFLKSSFKKNWEMTTLISRKKKISLLSTKVTRPLQSGLRFKSKKWAKIANPLR